MRLFSSSLPSRTTQVEVVEEEKEAFSVFPVAAQAASQVVSFSETRNSHQAVETLRSPRAY